MTNKTAKARKKFGFLEWLLIFLVAYFGMRLVFPPEEQNEEEKEMVMVSLKMEKDAFTLGETVKLTLENNSDKTFVLPDECPEEPFTVKYLKEGNTVELSAKNDVVNCGTKEGLHAMDLSPLAPEEKRVISYSDWNQELFGKTGTYQIEARLVEKIEEVVSIEDTTAEEGEGEVVIEEETSEEISTEEVAEEVGETSAEPVVLNLNQKFEVNDHTWIGGIWHSLIYIPLFNLMIWLTMLVPGHSLGWAIILLTVLIRLILLVPNQKALHSQRAMQELQPKLKEIQRQYANDQQKLSQETMKLWKEHKVNPFGSCLPMLVQLPILIALFFVVRQVNDGFSTSEIASLYGGLENYDVGMINTNFLGLDLAATNVIWLALLIGALQFLQMKLALNKNKKKGEKKDKSDPTAAMSGTMTYVMPALIMYMAYAFPAGVGLYWGISTVFGVGQQLVVNKEKIV